MKRFPMMTPVLWSSALVAGLALGACEGGEAPSASEAGAGPTTVGGGEAVAASAATPLEAKLLAGPWFGLVGEREPVQLDFATGAQGLTAKMSFTLFGRPQVVEEMAVTLEQPAKVRLKGTSHQRLRGVGTFILDDMEATLSEDGIKLSGLNRFEGQPDGVAWWVSTKSTLAELDPPLDTKVATALLKKGKWEGKVGDKPAKLAMTPKGDALGAKLTYGNTKLGVTIDVQANGDLSLVTEPRPTPQGLATETFRGLVLDRELNLFGGVHEISIQQGFVEQASSDSWIFQEQSRVPKN